MDEAIVRPMMLGDVEAVDEIEKGCFAVPWTHDAFVREITENKCARYLVAEVNGMVVAYAGMWLVIDEAHITNIAVHQAFRGRGYGELVTRALMRLAADTGMVFMTLEVRRSNLVAQSLYRKVGFYDVGFRKRYYEDNQEDALIMACEELPRA
ncbi:MAG: ribosomal protein S18-alanine N-acetyltransferase [Oscillospiraceae bacterium]|jgi:ribosomal-protein-alanine N-acetyltransferase|nr:ribosomal protein S18-alanine N-acetyltransferase [Oscillospiraceae bacterium]